MAADQTPPDNNKNLHPVLRLARRIAIAIAGGAVIFAGVAMLVLPGPGIVTIALGLAILALEFERPRIWLARLKAKGYELKDRVTGKKGAGGDDEQPKP